MQADKKSSIVIKIFEATAQNSGEVKFISDTLAVGLGKFGDQVSVVSHYDYEPCDVAVVMWSPRLGEPDRARATRKIRNLHGRNLLIVETPVFRSLKKWHFRIGFDHVHRAGRFFAKKHTLDRATAMGLSLKPWREPNHDGPIVVAGQLPLDYSLDGIDAREWLVDVVTHLERTTRRPICCRPHPLDYRSDYYSIQATLHMEVSRQNIDVDLARASMWVAYTSGSAIDAVLEGIPTICLSPANFAWEVSSHTLSSINSPWLGDRTDWLANLAYAQWTHEEIGSGEFWSHLRDLYQPI